MCNGNVTIQEKILIIVLSLIIILGFGLGIVDLSQKDDEYTPESEIETQITSETTTSSTTTHKTTKTTKKVVKTTQKVNSKIRTATGSKSEYLAYAQNYGNLNNTQLTCLDYLWEHESNWNPNSVNKSSGACGIPQAYPCKKIQQSEGSNDWKAQIRWGLKYINGRYKNPCGAWNHFKNKRWY